MSLIKRCVASYTLICFLISNVALAAQPLSGVAARASLANTGQPSDPTLKQAMNGTTVVDIAAPSAKGISSNMWNDFNVGEEGIIFNNSAAPVLTQLGGWVDGNRRLAGGSASVILNQVVGTNRSSLMGQVEIAGKSAEFILANPNGITCNGCGFINTPSVSLITGRSRMGANGDLLFDISDGDFLLEGHGLNATNIDRFDIISRYAQINADLFANNLSIINGSNEFNYGTKSVLSNAAANGSGSFQYALSSAALGGMYGNSIRLIGTEKGLGVNLQGVVQSIHDLKITAEGDLQLRHMLTNDQLALQSQGNINIQELAYAKTADLQAAQSITVNGLLAASDNIALKAQDITQSGSLYVGLNNDNTFNHNAGLSIDATTFTNTGDFYLGGGLIGNQTQVMNNGTMVFGGSAPLIVSSFDNRQSVRMQSDNASIQAGTLSNSGEILHEGTGLLELQAQSFNNTGVLGSNGQLHLNATVFNNQGRVFANATQLDLGEFDNSSGQLQSTQLTLNADQVSNVNGRLLALGNTTDDMRFTIVQNFDNHSGVVYSDAGSFTLNANSLDNHGGTFVINNAQPANVVMAGLLNNDGGVLQFNTHSMQVDTLSNQGGEWLSQSLTGNINTLINTGGFIQSNGIDLHGQMLDNKGGIILATDVQHNILSLDFSQHINNLGGAVIRQLNGDVILKSASINNDASVVDAGQNGSIQFNADVLNNSGAINAFDTVAISGTSLTNTGYLAAGQVNIDLNGNATNTSGVIRGAIQLHANTLLNDGGSILFNNNSALTLSGDLHNVAGAIATLQDTSVGDVHISANTLTNSGEMVFSAAQTAVNVSGRFDNLGTLQGTQALLINAGELFNNAGFIQANDLNAVSSAAIHNINNGYIGATTLALTANAIDNNGGMIDLIGTNQASLQLNATQVDNTGGIIKSAAVDWQLDFTNINNQGGKIIHNGTGTLSVHTSGLFINEGTLYSANRLELSAGTLENRGDLLSGHQLSLTTTQGIINDSTGRIEANDATELHASQQTIDNQGYWFIGDTLSSNSSTLGSDLINEKTLIVGNGVNAADVNLHFENVHNTGSISYNNNGTLLFDSASFVNDGLIIASAGGVSWSRNASSTAQGFTNNNTLIASKLQLHDAISGDTLVNNGAIQAQDFVVDATRFLNNSNATLQGSGNTTWNWNATRISNLGDWINNANDWTVNQLVDGSGRIFHTGTGQFSLALAAGSDITGAYINTKGHALLSGSIQGGSIVVQGQIQRTTLWADQGITIGGNTPFTNTGTNLITNNDIVLQTSLINNADGLLQAGGQFLLNDSARIYSINNAGAIQANSVNITGAQLTNSGTLSATGVIAGSSNLDVDAIDNHGLLHLVTDNTSINAAHSFNNQGGEVVTKQLTLTTPTLSNQNGVITAYSSALGQTSTLHVQTLDNTQGHIHAVQLDQSAAGFGSLSVVADTQLNNTQGSIDLLNLATDTNGYSHVVGGNVLSIKTASLINDGSSVIGSDGLLNLSSQDAQGQFIALNNAGYLQSSGDLTVHAAGLQNTGSIVGGDASSVNIDLHGADLSNGVGGIIGSRNNVNIIDVNRLDNQSIITALNDVNLAATAVPHIGNVLAGHNLSLAFSGDLIINQGEQLTAPGALTITTPGDITNSGDINAHNQLNLNGVHFTNEQTGRVIAGPGLLDAATQIAASSVFNFSSSIVNNGSISVAGDLKVVTPQFLNSATGVLVTGGTVSFDLINAGAFDNAGTIYAFNNLNVTNANSITNHDSAQLVAVNNMSLSSNNLLNDQSRIETIQGDLTINVAQDLTNKTTNPGMTVSYPSYQVDRSGFDTTSPYFNQMTLNQVTGEFQIAETTVRTFSSLPVPANIHSGANLTIQGTATINNTYGNLYAAKDLSISGANLNNLFAAEGTFVETIGLVQAPPDCSFGGGVCVPSLTFYWDGLPTSTVAQSLTDAVGTIHAGGNLTGNLSGSIDNSLFLLGGPASSQVLITPNQGTPITGTLKNLLDQVLPGETQQKFYTNAELTGQSTVNGSSTASNGVSPVNGGNSAGGSSSLTAAGNAQNNVLSANLPNQLTGAQTQAGTAKQWPSISFNVLPLNFDPAHLGNLFVVNQSPSATYLIETRPEFTQLGNFLGSDYLLNALGYDPNKSIKRLGDAFYEDQLVRDALISQANTRYVDDVTNDFDLMQTLMNNAVKEASTLKLSIGVELTPEQSAALTQDMMWLVKRNVMGQEVLVPQLYLTSVSPDKLAASKSVIGAGGNINLTAKTVNNQGTLYSNGNTSIVAGNLSNSGDMHASGDLSLIATQLQNTGALNSGNNLMLVTRGNLQQDGRLFAQGDVRLLAAGGISNAGTVTAGHDILAMSQGDVVNKVTGQINATGNVLLRSTQSNVINDHGQINGSNVTLDAFTNVEQSGRGLTAANQLNLVAGSDVVLNADKVETITDINGHHQQVITFDTSSLVAGGNLSLVAGRDIQVQGATLKAGGDIDLHADRDVNLQAVANESDSEYHSKRHEEIHQVVTHDLVTLQSGSNIDITAGQDANLIGTNMTADNSIAISASRDTNISAVVDSVYDYKRDTKKGFFSSKTHIDETKKETATGGVLNAAGNVSINTHTDQQGELIGEKSGNVNLLGAAINAGGAVAISADEGVNVSGLQLQSVDYHQTKSSGMFGLKKSDIGTATSQQTLENASITAGNAVYLISGRDINLVAADVRAHGDINLQAVDQLIIAAGDVVTQTQHWAEKSSIISGGSLYKKTEHRDGTTSLTGQASNIVAGGAVNAQVGEARIVGSNVSGDAGVDISADSGDIDVTTYQSHSESFSKDMEIKIGMGDIVKTMTRPDQLIKTKNGRVTMTVASANYDDIDTKTTVDKNVASEIQSQGNVILQATAGSVNVVGSRIAADTDGKNGGAVGLSGATGVNIIEANNTYQKETKEIHGSAEVSVVVQHQAVEVVMAMKGVLAAKDKLAQSKREYTDYKRNRDQLQQQLSQLESDFANHVPGVSKDDVMELRALLQDVKDDEEYYQAGVALAAANLATATTTLVQQTIAAAASTGTWGFNAGIQLDIDATKTDGTESASTAQGSSITGNQIIIETGINDANGKLNTQGTQTTIQGSQLIAQQSTANDGSLMKSGIAINTGDLSILNSRDTHESKTVTEHGHITAQVTAYGAAGGASISGSFDRNQEASKSSTVNNSELNADNISLITSNDMNIAGATVRANDDLNVDVGGNLNLESQQNRYSSRNNGFGLSGGVSLGGDGGEGVNAGVNMSHGMSSTYETVLTSLTSGGVASVNVIGNTQITGALLGTIDAQGHDVGQLNFNTGSLITTDLRNTSIGSQTSVGFSTNISIGTKPNTATEALSPTNTGNSTSGTDLKINSSNINYTNSQENSASKSLATLGHGNITVGGAQLEKDGQLTDAGNTENSVLFALNRDTAKTDKSLWNSNESQHVDANIDNRFFTQDGRAEIAKEFDEAPAAMQMAAQNVPAPNGGNKVEDAIGQMLDKLSRWTVGLVPSNATNGGLLAQLPILFGADDIRAGVYQVRPESDPLVNDTDYMKAADLPYFDTVQGPGKQKLDGMWVTIAPLTDITLENSTYQNFTNGMLNNLPKSLINAMEQTGSSTVTEFYNPSHGILGDLLESGVDKFGGNNIIHSGIARQAGEFIQDVTMARGEVAGTNFVGHSQGTLLLNAGLTTLDKGSFSSIEFTDKTTPTFFINGAAVNAQTMMDSTNSLGFQFVGSSTNKDDLVGELLGGNQGVYLTNQDSPTSMPFLDRILSVTNITKMFNGKYPIIDPITNMQIHPTSPHATYTCLVNCGDKPIGTDDINGIPDSVSNKDSDSSDAQKEGK